jgi:ATP-binding cassette, subfamily B, bacterial PglK
MKSKPNKNNESFLGLLGLVKEIFAHIEKERRRQYGLLMVLTLFGAFAEVLSLSSIIPFIVALTNPIGILDYKIIAYLTSTLGIKEPSELIIFMTISFIFVSMLAGITRLILLRYSIILANLTGADISIKIFNTTLYQPYETHISRNSSEVISNITMKVNMAIVVLTSMVTAISSFILFSVLIITLLIIDPVICVIAFFTFGISYSVIAALSKKRLKTNSIKLSESQNEVMRNLQEGMGAIREILLENIQIIYRNNYASSIVSLKKATSNNAFINQYPKYILEAVGMVLIASLAAYYSFKNDGGVINMLPVLGALAYGAQRLLPLMQQFYGNWAYVIGSQAQLQEVNNMLCQESFIRSSGNDINLDFIKTITLKNIFFKYQGETDEVLKDVNLEIKKGSRIGITGTTGSGKSTLMDIILGLLKPTKGSIIVDGQEINDKNILSWQRNIAHVPQNIFLLDATIEKNIAFSEKQDDIDIDLVRDCAKQAQLHKFINSTSLGYQTMVGERGVKLSGGQLQRIGIARALYKKASILVFDEATSALDYKTEEEVMKSIQALSSDLTIFIVAHRLSTIDFCDNVINLKNNSLNKKG